MEFKVKLPGGGYMEFKRTPMPRERFAAICALIGVFIVGSGLIKFFELMIYS